MISYTNEEQKNKLLQQLSSQQDSAKAPMFILDIDGACAMGYVVDAGKAAESTEGLLTLQKDDDPDLQAIPQSADIEKLLSKGLIRPSIFAGKTRDVRLPKPLVDQINARLAADDAFSICLLTSRNMEDVEFILRASGVRQPQKMAIVADSGNRLRIGQDEKIIHELTQDEQQFIDGVEQLSNALNEKIKTYLGENNLEMPKLLFIERKGAAINVHWRGLCDELKLEAESPHEQAIANIVDKVLTEYVNRPDAPKQVSGGATFKLISGPMTREIKLASVSKADGVKALVEAAKESARDPELIVFSGDDCAQKPDNPNAHGTDYDAMKYINTLENGRVIHVHHPLQESLVGTQPDPAKAAPEDVRVDVTLHDPQENALFVANAVALQHITRQQDGPQNWLAIYSNRPPCNGISGGALRVIAASQPNIWVGPSANAVEDEQWRQMREDQRHQLTPHVGDDGITVFTFPVPRGLQHSQYDVTSNEMLWPIMHSMTPNSFFRPEMVSENPAEIKLLKSNGYAKVCFEGYNAFNGLANRAMQTLQAQGALCDADMKWVHDYQCLGVKGDVYSQHIPFPSLDYLKKVRFSDKPLLETEFFKGVMNHYAHYPVISFQRPIDMKHFIETAAVMDEQFRELNSELFDENGARDLPLGKESQKPVTLFGQKTTLLNIPVGVSQAANLSEAQKHENCLDKTALKHDALAQTGIEIDVATTSLKAVLGRALEDDHRMFVSISRNDYTKNALEKLDAMDAFLQDHPEEIGHSHLVMMVQPTRESVNGYKEYATLVKQKAKQLREKYGDSIIVVPEGIEHEEVMALFRHPNTVAALGVGLKDGHDLTMREAVDARADGKVPPIALILTDGIGASDILSGDEMQKGAFVIQTNAVPLQDRAAFLTSKLAETFGEIVQMQRNNEGKGQLSKRYEIMRAASAEFTAEKFGKCVLNAAQLRKECQPERGGLTKA